MATLAETRLLGVKPEDISGRAEANPLTHGAAEAVGLGTGFLTGTGEAGLVAKTALKVLPRAEKAGLLVKAGSNALRAAMESGAIQGGDECKSLLGKGDSAGAVASHVAF